MKLPCRLTLVVAMAALAACSSENVGSNDLAVTRCGKTTVKGIDVYHGDNGGNPIDWAKVKGAGMSFAFAKATEGTTFLDSSFATNWPGIKAAGLKRGAYHFFHADLDPVAQANFFLATVGAIEPGDMLVLDMETTNGQTEATIRAHAITFLQTVADATGTTPLLYTSAAFLSSYGGLSAFPLWVANYGVSCPDVPSAWSAYTFWQSTGTGSLSVLSGDVDLDTFNGTLADLDTFGLGATDGGTVDASDDDEAAPPAEAAAPDASEPPSDAGTTAPDANGCACTSASRRATPVPWWAGAAVLVLARRRRVRPTRERVKKAPWTMPAKRS